MDRKTYHALDAYFTHKIATWYILKYNFRNGIEDCMLALKTHYRICYAVIFPKLTTSLLRIQILINAINR